MELAAGRWADIRNRCAVSWVRWKQMNGQEAGRRTDEMSLELDEVGAGHPCDVFGDQDVTIQPKRPSQFVCTRVKVLGYSLLMLSLVCWQTAGACDQALYRAVPDLQLNTFRQIATAIISGSYLGIKREQFTIGRGNYLKVLGMSLAQFLSASLYYAGVSMLPLSLATGFVLGMKMIIVAITMKILFGHKMNLMIRCAFIGSLLGLLLQSQPWEPFKDGFIPGFVEEDDNDNVSFLTQIPSILTNATAASVDQPYNVGHLVLIGYVLLLISVVFETVYMILVGEYLTSVNSAVLTFISAIIRLPLSVVFMFCIEQPVLVVKPRDILLVSIHCIANAVTLLADNTSYQLLPLVHVSIIESTETVLSLIPQYTIFRDHLGGRMDAVEIIGSVLIIASLLLSSISMLS